MQFTATNLHSISKHLHWRMLLSRPTQHKVSWRERRGQNKPFHSIVRKECIQILELFMLRTLWFWHLPLSPVPCCECEGPSLPLAAHRASWSQEPSKSQDPLLCRYRERFECRQMLTLKQANANPNPNPAVIQKNHFSYRSINVSLLAHSEYLFFSMLANNSISENNADDIQ